MRLTILGGDGGWPRPGGACSGYLVQHDGYSVLVDPGPGTFPRLVQRLPAREVHAVVVSHGHPDHCADLNPLLRARAFVEPAAPPLAVFAPPAALEAVLALDRAGVLDDAVQVRDLTTGDGVVLGPFEIDAIDLPHTWPNLGLRISAGGTTLVYTGDSGPSRALHPFAHGADLLLAEASHAERVPPDMAGMLSTAGQRGDDAHRAEVGALLLTHLLPGEDPDLALERATERFAGPITVARPNLVVDIGVGGPD